MRDRKREFIYHVGTITLGSFTGSLLAQAFLDGKDYLAPWALGSLAFLAVWLVYYLHWLKAH